MEDLKDLIPQTLPDDQRRLLDLIGPEAYAKLVEVYGGMAIYILKRDSFLRAARNEKIRQLFDGSNYRKLAAEFDLSEVQIRQIVSDIDKELREKPLDGQESIF